VFKSIRKNASDNSGRGLPIRPCRLQESPNPGFGFELSWRRKIEKYIIFQ